MKKTVNIVSSEPIPGTQGHYIYYDQNGDFYLGPALDIAYNHDIQLEIEENPHMGHYFING